MKYTFDITKGLKVVCFEVGYYDHPTDEAKAAFARIKSTVKQLEEDHALIRKWHGHLCLYNMHSGIVNPGTTPEMIEQAKAEALARNPGWEVMDTWNSNMHGIEGVSVRIREIKV